eukprot:CAMPEP_0177589140 /NCGR_PEP_ID=MMETSP0419_2-20121207/6627_1 /TAXON_ID=582737 /ORGANISM="Tetraselmis sp., Strain GSL018" /LENGTH=169 /DNA_ID=CAMNT_0019079439 /DNA_START=485 /DNA_END=994 /DNA_ORIENTATION=+
MEGRTLFEHHVGLFPISDDTVEEHAGRNLLGVSRLPPKRQASWRKEISREKQNATGDAITVGFVNLAGLGVSVFWEKETGENELVAQLEDGETLFELAYDSHRFMVRDETNFLLRRAVVQDLVISDCERRGVTSAMPQSRSSASQAFQASALLGLGGSTQYFWSPHATV